MRRASVSTDPKSLALPNSALAAASMSSTSKPPLAVSYARSLALYRSYHHNCSIGDLPDSGWLACRVLAAFKCAVRLLQRFADCSYRLNDQVADLVGFADTRCTARRISTAASLTARASWAIASSGITKRARSLLSVTYVYAAIAASLFAFASTNLRMVLNLSLIYSLTSHSVLPLADS